MVFPLVFFKFWYFDGPKGMISYFASFNKAFFQFFSTTLLVKTFFKPWKNEYREGLIGFSTGMGMCIKTVVICMTLALFLILVCIEVALFFGFLSWPVITVWLLFV